MPKICNHQALLSTAIKVAWDIPSNKGAIKLTYRKGSGFGIVFRTHLLQLIIRCIHGQKQQHQHQLYIKDKIPILFWANLAFQA